MGQLNSVQNIQAQDLIESREHKKLTHNLLSFIEHLSWFSTYNWHVLRYRNNREI